MYYKVVFGRLSSILIPLDGITCSGLHSATCRRFLTAAIS